MDSLDSSDSEIMSELPSDVDHDDINIDHGGEQAVIQPYMFEPELGSSDSDQDEMPPGARNDEDDRENRLQNSTWYVFEQLFQLQINMYCLYISNKLPI